MKKLGIFTLEAIAFILIIFAFGALDALVKGIIDWSVFAARSGLFTALTGVCVYTAGRFGDEEDR